MQFWKFHARIWDNQLTDILQSDLFIWTKCVIILHPEWLYSSEFDGICPKHICDNIIWAENSFGTISQFRVYSQSGQRFRGSAHLSAEWWFQLFSSRFLAWNCFPSLIRSNTIPNRQLECVWAVIWLQIVSFELGSTSSSPVPTNREPSRHENCT